MLRESGGLPGLGWEVSVRLSPGGWCVDRLLVGFETAGVLPARLAALPQRLGMPSTLVRELAREMSCASALLLAVENGAAGVELRVYQDFGETSGDAVPASGVAMRGCKWLPGAGSSVRGRRVTEYRRVHLDLMRLRELPRDLPARPSTLRLAWSVLGDLAGRVFDEREQLDFLAAQEAARGRASGCLRLQGSGLKLSEGLQVVQEVAARWGVEESALRLLSHRAGARPLSWAAAGLDGAGEPFVTLYALGHRDDAWAAARLVDG